MSKAKTHTVERHTSKRSPRLRHSAPGLRVSSDFCRHAGSLLQPALRVGAANDPLEREAESTAERIVSMPSPELAQPAADASPGGQGAAAEPLTRRASANDQPDLDTLETAPPIPADHQDPDVPPAEDVKTTGLVADDMKEVESGKPEDAGGEAPGGETPAEGAPAEGASAGEKPASDEEPAAQPARSGDAAVVGAEGGAAPADVAHRVAQPGSGRPLPSSVRGFMEPRFDKDFSDVRIHDTAEDRTAARRIGARAFTHRRHIWIGPGETVENRRLMAHELTHVVQQTKRGPAPTLKRDVDPSEETGEPEVRRGYLANKAEKYARKVPGYRLVTFILGKSPITGNRVVRNATNLLGALLGMIPGGDTLFKRLQESRIIEKAFEWVSSRLSRLNITWTRIKGLISDFFDYLPAWPSNAIRYAKKLFGPIVRDILTFIGEVKDKILEFIIRGALKLAGPLAEKVWKVIQKAGKVISLILADPLGFAKNLFRAVLKGFKQFGDNALKHIKKGLLGWLFGAIQGLEIKIPEKLDFKGLISIGLQIVGLTYDNFRAKLVKRLGPNGERKVAFLEKSVEVVKILVKEGFVGLWQRVLQMIDNFKQTIIGGIKDFVIKSLIMGGLSWLAGLSNPVGAVIKVVLAIYNIVKTFLERLDQILEVANSIFSSIGAIAQGRIQQAADFIEKTIAATIPVVISFLAALVPITGITNSIRNIIKKLRAPVDKAMGKMIGFLVKKAKKLFSKLLSKVNGMRKMPSAGFTIGKAAHKIYAKKSGKKAQIFVKSKEQTAAQAEAGMKKELAKFKAGSASEKEGGEMAKAFGTEEKKAETKAAKLKPGDTKTGQNKPTKELQKQLEQGAKLISEKGKVLADNPDVDTSDSQFLIRAVEPRFPEEGKVDTYKELKVLSGQEVKGTGLKFSAYYEADHLPEKSLLQEVKARVDSISESSGKGGTTDKSKDDAKANKEVLRGAPEGAPAGPDKGKKDAAAKPSGFGQLGELADKPGGDGQNLNAVLIYRPVHRAKPNTFTKASLPQIDKIIAGKGRPAAKESGIKSVMEKQIQEEAGSVKKIYTQLDKNSSGDVRKRAFGGLDSIVAKSNTLFNLGAKAAPHDEKDVGKGGEEGPRNALAMGGPQDFAKREGVTGSYGSLGPTGPFYERDHIVDKSFPLAVKGLKFGDDSLWGKAGIDTEAMSKGKPESEAKAIGKRKSTLLGQRIFSTKSGVSAYTESSGAAILLYRPVHRRVTGLTRSTDAKGALIGSLSSSAFDAARAYVRGDEGASAATAKEAVRSGLRPTFVSQFDKHSNAVRGEYKAAITRVEKANPGREKAARAAMTVIQNRVEGSLKTMREKTVSLT